MLKDVMNMSERKACRVVGLARSAYRQLPQAHTPADPDAGLRQQLRTYARQNPRHGFRRAWAWLRFDEDDTVNKKKVHRLWKEEGLQVRRAPRRKRAGQSSVPIVTADAPKVVWAVGFQFDSTVDGKKVKIASMVDEHTRMSLLDIVDRSITADRLIEELEKTFAIWGGPPMVLRMDNGPEFISEALQTFCAGSVGISYIPPGTPWNNGFIESFNNRLRDECLNRNCWPTLLEARVVIEDFKDDHNHQHRHSALGYQTRPSTLPDAPTSTTPWTARSTDRPQVRTGSRTDWTGYRGPATDTGASTGTSSAAECKTTHATLRTTTSIWSRQRSKSITGQFNSQKDSSLDCVRPWKSSWPTPRPRHVSNASS